METKIVAPIAERFALAVEGADPTAVDWTVRTVGAESASPPCLNVGACSRVWGRKLVALLVISVDGFEIGHRPSRFDTGTQSLEPAAIVEVKMASVALTEPASSAIAEHRMGSVVGPPACVNLVAVQGATAPVMKPVAAAAAAVVVAAVAAAVAAAAVVVVVVAAATVPAAAAGDSFALRNVASTPSLNSPGPLHRFLQIPWAPYVEEPRRRATLVTWCAQSSAFPGGSPPVGSALPLASFDHPPPWPAARPASTRPLLAIVRAREAWSSADCWREVPGPAPARSSPTEAVDRDGVCPSFAVRCPEEEEEMPREGKLTRLKRLVVSTHGGYTRSVTWV